MTGKCCLPCRQGRSLASRWSWNGSLPVWMRPWKSGSKIWWENSRPREPCRLRTRRNGGLRDGLGWLKAAVTLPGLPESLRNQFPAEIQKGADRVQTSLEASAAQDHSSVLQHLLQLYPVNRWEEKHEQS